MKFARALEANQTPEWKRAYIDYRALKKCITRITQAQETERLDAASPGRDSESSRRRSMSTAAYGSFGRTPPPRQTMARPRNSTTVPQISRWRSFSNLPPAPTDPKTLEELLEKLSELEKEFFELMDEQLLKVENFYQARERDWITQFALIKEQLRELGEHRKRFHEAQDQAEGGGSLPRALGRMIGLSDGPGPTSPIRNSKAKAKAKARSVSPSTRNPDREPEQYQHAKKRLKHAVLEFHRGLELLKNYRIMNKTGFRKAIKKFEKATRHRTFDLYTKEKIEPCNFATGVGLDSMLREVEDLYCVRFEGGNRKRARERLRLPYGLKTHHESAFRSGVLIGLAIPAIALGVYLSYQEHTREAIPQWAALLYVYGALFIPVLFFLLISLNLWAWTRARINYSFIFELAAPIYVDSLEYSELPAFLLLTLCYTFLLSFTSAGVPTVPATSWPAIWLGFAFILMCNPTPTVYYHSRKWLLGKLARLPISSFKRVEFVDFFLGDQLCSMVFSLSSLYFVGCAYQDRWEDPFARCSVIGPHWPIMLTLSSLPSLIRFMQSIKRWVDNGLRKDVINGGKYFAGMVQIIAYYTWRHQGSAYDGTFAFFILASVFNSTYTAAWDLLMDWSFFQQNAEQPFLRPELLYKTTPFVYYFAIVSNVIVRFIWVVYTPPTGPTVPVRTFIAATLEMLRRIQWNFFRLENEHIGNTDQYRVTREVPLPYHFEDDDHEDEGTRSPDEDGPTKATARMSVRMPTLSGSQASIRERRTILDDIERAVAGDGEGEH